MGESDYSFSLTTFSPSGRLVQIEYALQAVTAGATALGIKGKKNNSQITAFAINVERSLHILTRTQPKTVLY